MLSEILQQLTSQKSSIEDDIHTTFDELQKTLNVRKSVLLMELEVNYGLKQKVRISTGHLYKLLKAFWVRSIHAPPYPDIQSLGWNKSMLFCFLWEHHMCD